MNFDEIEWKIAIRPEEYEDKGCVRAILKDDLYPSLEVQTVTPRFYYHKKYHPQDKYSQIILYTKESCKDESEYFKPFVLDCVNKFKEDLKLNTVDIISLIPNGNNKYYPNIISVAKIISTLLSKPVSVIFDREDTQKNFQRDRQNRYNNLHGKFKLKEVNVSGKTILIIDDIRTTGISILECARVLKENNALNIISFALGTNSSNEPKIKEVKG